MKAKILVVVALMVMSVNAKADWQYVKWGMSLQKFEATAVQNKVELTSFTGESDRSKGFRYTGAYSTGAYNFKARFLVDAAETMRTVQLQLQGDPDNCYKLRIDMMNLYGKAIEQSNSHMVWHDVKNNNRVMWSNMLSCSIQYDVLKSASQAGL